MAPVTLTGDVTDAGELSDMTSESFQVVEFHSMSTSYSEHSAARAADYDAASTVLSFDQSPSAEVAEYVSNVAAATNGPVRRPPDVTVSASHDDTDAHISAKECGQDYAMHFFAGLSSDALHQLEIARSQAHILWNQANLGQLESHLLFSGG